MLNVSTFPCPSCHEFISSSMTACKYCFAPIDPQVASTAVELQDKVNRACNDASLLRNLAGAMWVGFFARFIPLVGLVGLAGMFAFFLLFPIKLIMWLVTFNGIETTDLDYKRAKREILVALGLWLLMLVVLLAWAFSIFR